uniref:Uncharacterized protein n=1 Tax=Cucumis melo TaxID=3656 RepID=A0A9I9EI26_CUCME
MLMFSGLHEYIGRLLWLMFDRLMYNSSKGCLPPVLTYFEAKLYYYRFYMDE